MTEKERKGLARACAELSGWRREHGGRGRRIPEELWSGAVELAQVVGPARTAQALKLDPVRLDARMRRAEGHERVEGEQQATFVEIGALPLASAPTVVELVRRDGERMRIEMSGPLDVVGLSRAFWSCRP